MATQQDNDFHQKIDLARRELLDMGLRANPLLNFRAGTKSLNVVDEQAGSVFNTLVNQKKAMRFLPVPAAYEKADIEQSEQNSLELIAESEEQPQLPALCEHLNHQRGDERFADLYLQTSLTAEKLDTTLLKIENEAHTLLQEQGVEVLYLAIGFLTWFEDSNSSTPRLAPLLLIPVELRRTSAKEVFSIAWTESDPGPNLALAAKLKGEFRVVLPDFDDELDPEEYFQQVQTSIASQPRWQVNQNAMALGLFSFGKFQMFTDLDPARWPEEHSLSLHGVISGLLGDGFTGDAELLAGISDHPNLKSPEILQLIKDADSSQTEAVLSVMQGANLVIQGPPGTGKSQTITNIIAEGLAQGKRILFVAQKMAALKVVKQRLDDSHLGDAVLELHSHKSTKKAFIDTLRDTLDQGKPVTPDRQHEYARLKVIRSQLNDYVEAISNPILNSGENYIQALGKQLKLKRQQEDLSLPEISFSVMADWSREALAEALRVTEAISAHIEDKGVPAKNPFFASGRTSLSPPEQQQIADLAASCLKKLDSIVTDSTQLSSDMGLPQANTLSQVEVLHRAASRAMTAPKLQGVQLNTDDWQQRRDIIRKLIHCGSLMTAIRKKHQDRFIPQAFATDLLGIRKGLAGRADKWWRIFSSEYRAAKSAYLALNKSRENDTPIDWLNHVDELLVYQEHVKNYQASRHLGHTLFQAQWQDEESDWEVLNTLSEWLINLYEDIGKGDIPPGITQFLAGCSQGANPAFANWQKRLDTLANLITDLVSDLKSLTSKIDLAKDHPCNSGKSIRLDELAITLTDWMAAGKLYDITRYNQLYGQLVALGLDDLAKLSESWDKTPEALPAVLLGCYYGGLVNHAYNSHSAIRHFDRLTHERIIKEFAEIDQSLFEFAKENLVNTLYDALPNKNAPGEMKVLRREMNKKRRHMPIRRLIAEAGRVIQQIKPVFMMSPMSVATYLPQGQIDFDLVIFDEASQIPAPEAFGAIARAKQVVVVGDSKQMPPTNFFGRALELDDTEAELSETADVESILGLMLTKGLPESMLRWHYRSRHHSLIAVSNAEFYQNKLMVFPSPGVDATGLKLNILDSVYDRGGSRTNKAEALHIAEAVIRHARSTPGQSLGVVAFSTAQRDAIILEVERLRRENPDLETFFSHHSSDEFFIKNLENVQGDERDVIYISVGYGRTASGKVSQSFGPLNSSGGERRLNVLITRARMSMEVFCNFSADDLVTKADSPLGLKAFKAFLKYAETGELDQSHETGNEADSPFEVEVHRAIESLGYQAEAQVGSNGFFIDLAVRDPAKPGRYILAVECDGATYHSSAFARDRDRIRQSVLEGLGWRFHRIWSTDWFRNATGEIERLHSAIKQSVAYYQTLDSDQATPEKEPSTTACQKPVMQSQIIRDETPSEGTQRQSNAYVVTNLETVKLNGFSSFEQISNPTLHEAIESIAEVEGPIHIQLLVSRITAAAGFARTGVKIRRQIEQRVHWLKESGRVEVDGDFILRNTTRTIDPRDWSSLDRSQRKIEYVSDIELEQAVQLTVRDACSISIDDCISASLALIGFKRATSAVKSRVTELISRMVEDNKLILHDGRLKKIK